MIRQMHFTGTEFFQILALLTFLQYIPCLVSESRNGRIFLVNRRPLGIDPHRGTGTAYEGYVKVPKPGGIKKGWHRQFAVICDFKLFLFDAIGDRQTQISQSASLVIDMR
jgi:hypothetical protein